MPQAKILILGASSAGKTTFSMHGQSSFGPEYGKLVGVSVGRTIVQTGGGKITLFLWDIDGAAGAEVRARFARGSNGLVVMADATRRDTLNTAFDLLSEMKALNHSLHSVVFINKCDVAGQEPVLPEIISRFSLPRTTIITGSARTGEGVATVFAHLADALMRDPVGNDPN